MVGLTCMEIGNWKLEIGNGIKYKRVAEVL